MSLHEEIRTAERSLDELKRCAVRLERELGDRLDVRRIRSDIEHLRLSLSMLAGSAGPEERAGPGTPEMIVVPDTPYDRRLWTSDADDEGLGVRDHHAP
ncbi:hypothetical protein [Streptomyces aidingensis]|uniref:Uncharacterized protein n=1 Tax=Streptomyces aidingensis TaxID=910347 RepID=A0A1I1ESV4_9ACTN|nr:hypothetical protein [Streptomyces aidingensis]SFB90205.1 hypothetical protein SAMN05421773_101450 [Streptomyces aidingensis]